MIVLGAISIVLVCFCVYLSRQKDCQVAALLKAQTSEREAWASERRDLNNRIQVPEAAPFMDTTPDTVPPIQHVPFEDDDAFHKAMEEAGLATTEDDQWP
jgi:hypothetical protein